MAYKGSNTPYKGGFSVNGIHTSDIGLSVSNRDLTAPKRKNVRVTIPYSNGSYDFTELYGKPFFEDRTLTFTFDLIGDQPTDISRQLSNLYSFVMFVTDTDIYDDDIPGYHLHGSIDEPGVEYEENGRGVSVTVPFTVDPFIYKNEVNTATLTIGNNTVYNFGYPVQLTVTPTGTSCAIQIGNLVQSFSGKTTSDIALEHGENNIEVTLGGAVIEWQEAIL